MLVMPFAAFKEQGRIQKSVRSWRDEALADGRLVPHVANGVDDTTVETRNNVVIFVSHTWWDRDYRDETNDQSDRYDRGAPDYQAGHKKNLKWRTICSGVGELVRQQGLRIEDVVVWIDWQSIAQDDQDEKSKGVASLLKYVTLCDFMLVPAEVAELRGKEATYTESIPDYGTRGWCRCESWLFSLWAEMHDREVQLFAITARGTLQQYPAVQVIGEADMPSAGEFSNPSDKDSVEALEAQMLSASAAYGAAVVWSKFNASDGAVDLSRKMLRADHVDSVAAALIEHPQTTSLSLASNQLGANGARKLAAVLKKTEVRLTSLNLESNNLGSEGAVALAEGLKGNRTLTSLNVCGNAIIKSDAAHDWLCDVVCEDLNGVRRHDRWQCSPCLRRWNCSQGCNWDACEACHSLDHGHKHELKLIDGMAGLRALCAVLRDTLIAELDLGSNSIGGYYKGTSADGEWVSNAEAITVLCDGLKDSAVTSLDLDSNRISELGCSTLRDSFEGTQIPRLNLAYQEAH